MENIIDINVLFNKYKLKYPISEINQKINQLVLDKKIYLLNNAKFSYSFIKEYEKNEEKINDFVNKILEYSYFATFVDDSLLRKYCIDLYEFIHTVQKKDYKFEIYGNIITKGCKIHIWKENKLSFEQVMKIIENYDEEKQCEILKNEYFSSKFEYSKYIEGRFK
ncbi:hypothetical protein [Spiroplasma culicicola]|uniref:Uncharacterized protein n=1 Tax=Spiroplasma culicicola AES-1 TaxID=1276246 RepID=W6A7F7_9MOLU|nr:hypothetical protein [Spiroplasma culicicola]AHI52775.1 hypothetical protein SCULI_v1c04340 [Spiroplasma culicicola AES-1]